MVYAVSLFNQQLKGNIMQGNGNLQKTIRTQPRQQRNNAAQPRGKQWQRTDKRAIYSQK
jgi:hypothetical protein